MRKKGTKRRIMVMLIAAMLLMATSVTSFAKSHKNGSVEGILDTWGTGAKAETYSNTGTGSVYVSLAVEYVTSTGNVYNTGPITKNGRGSVTVTGTPAGAGKFISAVSYHGTGGKEFMLAIGAN